MIGQKGVPPSIGEKEGRHGLMIIKMMCHMFFAVATDCVITLHMALHRHHQNKDTLAYFLL